MRFRNDPSTLRGSLAAVITPFTEMGEVDIEGLTALAQWQRDAGADGLSIGGSTGEPSSQTIAERIAAMTAVAKVSADTIPFLPATGSVKLDETLALTQAAYDLGADAALLITPYYAKPTQHGLVEWYTTIAGEFPDLPFIVYNVPTRTAVDIAPETVVELRRRADNIVGIKETTKDFEHFSRVLQRAGRDFLVWSGIELLCLPLLALGGAGYISASAISRRGHSPIFTAPGMNGVLRTRRRSIMRFTRLLICCSSRPTRRRPSGCCNAAASSPRRMCARRCIRSPRMVRRAFWR